MKLLLVVSRNFWPVSAGHEYMVHNYCEKLHSKYGVDISVVSLDSNKEEAWPSFVSKVYFLKKKSNLKFLLSSFKYFFSRKQSLQSILYFNKKSAKELTKIVDEVKPDSVLIDLVRMSRYAEYIPSNYKLNLYAEDLFSARYQMMYEKKQYKNALGQLSTNKFFAILGKIPFLLKTILKKETIRIRNEERKASVTFEKAVFVSSKEANEFNRLFNTNIGVEVTMGYDTANDNYLNYKHSGDKLAIIGNFTYAPNKDSLIYIINEVLPKIKSKFTLDVVGKIEEDTVNELKRDNVNYLGFLDNTNEALCKADLFLSPIVYGTGIKTKILQSLSLGIPTITNDIGIMNIKDEIKECLIVENDAEKIAKAVDDLLADENRRNEMSKKSVDFIKKNHDWDKIIETLYQVIGGTK